MLFPAGAAQETIFPKMIEIYTSSDESATVYPTTATQNELLVTSTVETQGGSRLEAFRLLHSRVMLPSTKQPPLALKVVHKYLTRSIDYFFSAIGTTAMRIYVKSLHAQGHKGVTREKSNDQGTRFHLELGSEAAAVLAKDHEYIHDVVSLNAIKDATAAVFKRFGGGSRFVEPSSTPGDKPGLACLVAHMALVCTKIEEKLKKAGKVPVPPTPGINPGHRGPWVKLLGVLDKHFVQRGETRNGLRFIDGESLTRGWAPVDTTGEGDISSFGHWTEDHIYGAQAPGHELGSVPADAGTASTGTDGQPAAIYGPSAATTSGQGGAAAPGTSGRGAAAAGRGGHEAATAERSARGAAAVGTSGRGAAAAGRGGRGAAATGRAGTGTAPAATTSAAAESGGTPEDAAATAWEPATGTGCAPTPVAGGTAGTDGSPAAAPATPWAPAVNPERAAPSGAGGVAGTGTTSAAGDDGGPILLRF